MAPAIPGNGTHPRLQWLRRGTPTITPTDALETALPVTVLDNTVFDADAYYHRETDTLIVVQDEVVQTVLARNGALLRCPHGRSPEKCPTCRTWPSDPSTTTGDPDESPIDSGEDHS